MFFSRLWLLLPLLRTPLPHRPHLPQLLVATEHVTPLRVWLAESSAALEAAAGSAAGAAAAESSSTTEDKAGGKVCAVHGKAGGGDPSSAPPTSTMEERKQGREAALCWGLKCVAEALAFLNNDAG